MKTVDCPSTCTKIEPFLQLSEHGDRLADLSNKLRLVQILQSSSDLPYHPIYPSLKPFPELKHIISQMHHPIYRAIRYTVHKPLTPIGPVNRMMTVSC